MSLSQELLVWETSLSGKSLGPRLFLAAWKKVALVMPLWLTLAVVRVALSTSVADFLGSLCGLLPQYSAGAAALLLTRHPDRLIRLMHHVRLMAEDLERTERDHGKSMRPSAKVMHAVRRVGPGYALTGCVVTLGQMLLAGPPAPTIGDEAAKATATGYAVLIVTETVKWIYFSFSYFILWALLASVLIAMNAMYGELVQRASAAFGAEQVQGTATMYLQLVTLQAEFKDLTFQPLPHILAGAGLVPLINTFQFLLGVGNAFALMTIFTLPVIFGSLSFLGDRLEVQLEQLALAVYANTDVIGEPLHASKIRLMLLTSLIGHQGRAGCFNIRGFGSLNLRAAFVALHRWYQYLQLLMGSAS